MPASQADVDHPPPLKRSERTMEFEVVGGEPPPNRGKGKLGETEAQSGNFSRPLTRVPGCCYQAELSPNEARGYA